MAYNPLIIIPGPATTTVDIADNDGNKIKQAWPVQLDQKALTDMLKSSLMKMMLLRKDAGFSDSVAKIVADAFEPLSLNPDGTKKYNAKAPEFKRNYKNCSDGMKALFQRAVPADELINAIGEENIYMFNYDIFGDTGSVAKNLNDFIIRIKAENNADKADILCISLGGAVLKAYLAEYSHNNDIEKVISVASLMNGASLIADAFENKLSLKDTGALLSLLGENGATVSSLMGMLPPDAVENTVSKCMNVVTSNMINCTMMWACIPNDRFDAIYSSLIKQGSELDKKVSALHSYSVNLNAQLKALQANGMKFYQFCGYGKPLLPITENNSISSDGIVETALASFGAKCSETDSEPDNSGCLFPDTTVFVKNADHFSIHKNNDLFAKVANVLK